MEHGIVKTIVVVGRDIPYAKNLANALRSFDYSIVEALDSSFTLDKLKLAKIDLIIIEANCGQVDTLGLLDSILNSNLLIPIVCYADFAPQEHISSFQARWGSRIFSKTSVLR